MKKVVGFGEIMLRMSPAGYYKFSQVDEFKVNYTGAEANVCVALSATGMTAEYVTKVPDNDIARCAIATMRKFGVGVRHVVYGGDRLGSYYLERGASQRPSKVIYDRKYSAISMAKREEFDWETILEGVDAFHFTGITVALGEDLPGICLDACRVAKKKGVRVFCDLNYRKNLWTPEQAQHIMPEIVANVDVLVGNEEDAEKVLGVKAANSDVAKGELDRESYVDVARQLSEKYGLKAVAFTLRTSISASDNNWAGIIYADKNAYFSKEYKMHIVDRVGGGDSFAAGLIYAICNGYDHQKTIDFAVAASCLKHSIELDFNLSTVSEIEALMGGDGSGRVQR
ncbi:MAG: 2-dehydro-3-deoxygluconokinase [Anaerosporomusa subterranea]|jgi:2-dehydro-3-deoxygluconokinase|nr:2-dehydro-3-deoxygluconokinase [Anaerosporomusa subterranea]